MRNQSLVSNETGKQRTKMSGLWKQKTVLFLQERWRKGKNLEEIEIKNKHNKDSKKENENECNYYTE